MRKKTFVIVPHLGYPDNGWILEEDRSLEDDDLANVFACSAWVKDSFPGYGLSARTRVRVTYYDSVPTTPGGRTQKITLASVDPDGDEPPLDDDEENVTPWGFVRSDTDDAYVWSMYGKAAAVLSEAGFEIGDDVWIRMEVVR